MIAMHTQKCLNCHKFEKVGISTVHVIHFWHIYIYVMVEIPIRQDWQSYQRICQLGYLPVDTPIGISAGRFGKPTSRYANWGIYRQICQFAYLLVGLANLPADMPIGVSTGRFNNATRQICQFINKLNMIIYLYNLFKSIHFI